MKQRLLKDMFFSIKKKYPKIQCFILVLDTETAKVISSTIQMIELMNQGVTGVEKLELNRKRFKNVHAIYFISPTQGSIDRLVKDFSDKKKPQYAAAHVYFSN